MKYLVLMVLLLSVNSCSEKEPRYTVTQIRDLLTEEGSGGFEVFVNEHQWELRALCRAEVSPVNRAGTIYEEEGCVGNYKRLRVRGIDFLIIEFDSISSARAAAQNINQYFARNWLIDDLRNEPVLIDFVQRRLDLQDPHLLPPQEKSCGWWRKTCSK
jgi:hypothetical protein